MAVTLVLLKLFADLAIACLEAPSAAIRETPLLTNPDDCG
jgi:hypothetical protein